MSKAKQNANNNQPSIDELSYEQALAELEIIVASLEANQLSLDETMALYERGQALTKHCIELLDKAELRVKKLSGESLVDVALDE
jgi:exodeoxyribonuclease VII small subunit